MLLTGIQLILIAGKVFGFLQAGWWKVLLPTEIVILLAIIVAVVGEVLSLV